MRRRRTRRRHDALYDAEPNLNDADKPEPRVKTEPREETPSNYYDEEDDPKLQMKRGGMGWGATILLMAISAAAGAGAFGFYRRHQNLRLYKALPLKELGLGNQTDSLPFTVPSAYPENIISPDSLAIVVGAKNKEMVKETFARAIKRIATLSIWDLPSIYNLFRDGPASTIISAVGMHLVQNKMPFFLRTAVVLLELIDERRISVSEVVDAVDKVDYILSYTAPSSWTSMILNAAATNTSQSLEVTRQILREIKIMFGTDWSKQRVEEFISYSTAPEAEKRARRRTRMRPPTRQTSRS